MFVRVACICRGTPPTGIGHPLAAGGQESADPTGTAHPYPTDPAYPDPDTRITAPPSDA